MCSLETKGSNFAVQFSFKRVKTGPQNNVDAIDGITEKLNRCANFYSPYKESPAVSSTSAHSTLFFYVTLTTWASNSHKLCCFHELFEFSLKLRKTFLGISFLSAANERAPATESRDLDGATFKGR